MNWRARADRLRALPLPVVLEQLGATPDAHDPAKWRTPQGILSVTGPKFMNWNQGWGGGGAIDLVMHVRQVGFGQALEWLERRFDGVTSPQPGSTPSEQPLALPAPVTENWLRPLWHTPTMFLFALCCFIAEWGLRRWKGMA